jgi:tetratricopeptide (TPR) repeat protein
MPQGIKVFVSYAHEDDQLRKRLDKNLSLLKHQGLIDVWYDRDIDAGGEWEREIDTHLNNAQLILLLVSPDFMASQYCYDIEMRRAMERHRAGVAHVIPIILRPVDWKGAPFSQLQALPTDGKPITSWRGPSGLDNAFQNATAGIRKVIEELLAVPWYDEGKNHYEAGRYEEALVAYEEALRLNPKFSHAYYGKGNTLYHLQRFQESLLAYEQALRFGYNSADAYYDQGNALYHLQRYQEAVAAYEQAIQLNPNLAVAYYDQGNALYHLERYQEAVAAYEQAIKRGFNTAAVYYDQGNALQKLGRMREAQLAHQQAQRLKQ